jgi:hypothetical protein
MDPNGIVQVIAGVVTPLISLITFFSRRKRLRNEIRENLALVQELDKDEVLKEHSLAAMWLRGKISIDVARLAGFPLGTPKKPVPWGSVATAAIACVGLSYWTYYINRTTFSWYSLIPGVFAFLFAVSVYGMFINREIPPSEEAQQSDEVLEQPSDAGTQNVNGEGTHSSPSFR